MAAELNTYTLVADDITAGDKTITTSHTTVDGTAHVEFDTLNGIVCHSAPRVCSVDSGNLKVKLRGSDKAGHKIRWVSYD